MKVAEDLARQFLDEWQRGIREHRLRKLERLEDGSLRCPEHDHAVDESDPVLSCPGCVAAADRHRAAQERRERLRELWPVPTLPRWDWARLGRPWAQRVDPRLVELSRQWTPRDGLLVLGPTGCGKTSGVVARLWDLYAEALLWASEVRPGPCPLVPTLYVTEIQLVQARRRHPLGHGESPLVSQAMRSPCLVLDEVGATGDLLTHEVADERNRLGLPTVALSGFPAEELIGRVGDACARRLEQGSRVVDLHQGSR